MSTMTRALFALLAGTWMVVIGAPVTASTAHFTWFDYRGRDPSDRIPQKPHDYRNPIIQGFYSDPSVVRVGADYYLVTSTFGYFPGLPIFHSRDLVHWTQIANAISRPDDMNFKGLGLSSGLYAPAIRFHDGRFYILNTCVKCGGNYVIAATNPKGPWSRPVWLPELNGDDGYDPSLFFDDDGRAWVVNNGPPEGPARYDGHRAIWMQQFDPQALKLIGPRWVVVDSGVDPRANPSWIEGPHLLKKDGFYYLSAAEGGTGEGHSQVIFRADRVTGPYRPFSGNPILTQRDLPKTRALPITSAGHADIVKTQNGEWWAVFLATRPYGDNLYNTGRETFLLPVRWRDGWPTILQQGKAIPFSARQPDLPRDTAKQPTSGPFHVHEKFGGTALPLDWMMLRNPSERWWQVGHGLTLKLRPERLGDEANPSFLGRRQQHRDINVETRMNFSPAHDGEKAGLAIVQSDHFYYFVGVVRDNGRLEVRVERRAGRNDPAEGLVLARKTIRARQTVYLGLDTRANKISFRFAVAPGAWRSLLAGADNSILSTKTAGGFIGTTVGLYATGAVNTPQ